jgi:hypothetical protein
MSKSPKDKHRMRRPQPKSSKPGRRVESIKKSYSKEQLSEIGAIAMTWNQLELQIDFLLLIVLKMPVGLWMPLVKRINGMDGKFAILRLRAEQSTILTDDARECIKLSLAGVSECKKYRDAIVHSLTFDVDKGIAQEIGRRAETQEVLVTMEALTGVYNRLEILLDELRYVDLLLRLGDEEGAATIYRDQPDPLKLRRERDVPIGIAQVREHQKRRQSLPPLPKFPEESENQDWMNQYSGPRRYAQWHPSTGVTEIEPIPPQNEED